MIGPRCNGMPRPVGSTFRQRTLWAEDPEDGRHKQWIVSAVDTLKGPVVEIRKHHAQFAFVASDLEHHSAISNLFVQVRDALTDVDGWTDQTVKPCSVNGCDRPLPLWEHYQPSWKNGECYECSVRTVLACALCDAPDSWHYTNREAGLASGLCFSCFLWVQRADNPEIVTPDYGVYSIRSVGSASIPRSSKGFAGAKWVVHFDDGREVRTDDLWCGGFIPEWLRCRFTPNATVTPV